MLRKNLFVMAAAALAGLASMSFAADSAFNATRAGAIQPKNQIGREAGDVLLFDSITGSTPSGTTSTPNTYMGEPVNGSLLGGATPSLTGIDCAIVNFTGTTINTTDLQLHFTVWGSHSTASSPVFSNNLGTFNVDFGPVSNFATSSFLNVEGATPGVTPGITLATPLALPSNQHIGFTFNWTIADQTGTQVSMNNLNALLRTTGAFAVGTPDFAAPNYGYYRNAGGETNFNFLNTSSRNIGANSGVYMRAFVAAVPEPTTLGLAGLGLVGLVARRRRA